MDVISDEQPLFRQRTSYSGAGPHAPLRCHRDPRLRGDCLRGEGLRGEDHAPQGAGEGLPIHNVKEPDAGSPASQLGT
jgi:hypothetical protein